MNTKEKILQYIVRHKSVAGQELASHLGISKQAVNKHIRTLILENKIIKEGVTRGTLYRPAIYTNTAPRMLKIKKTYSINNLEEHEVFRNIDLRTNLKSQVGENAFAILRYAFTEILNNAIDHSESLTCSLEVVIDLYTVNFVIRDFGIGIFQSISSKLSLKDEHEALGELLKGKTTTMRDRHSGEGIFFSSKSADVAAFRSHNIYIVFDNLKNDIFVEEKRFLKGSEVRFSISRNTRRDLSSIFSKYSPEDYDYRFERTKVFVKLYPQDYVSRSEAKRLLSGLDKFKEIVLDFKGVTSIAQGFADEIFRVFQTDHPDIKIMIENANSILQQMINHVVDNN